MSFLEAWLIRGLTGTQLPTVRQLAVELKINANTVSRVYSELESEGILSTRQGKGTFVREPQETGGVVKKDILNELLDELLIRSCSLGYSPQELLDGLTKKVKVAGLNGKDKGSG